MKGQWQEPTGLSYGGSRPERSHLVLQQALREHLPDCRQLAFIDWHTGLGTYAEPFFLCFNEPGGWAGPSSRVREGLLDRAVMAACRYAQHCRRGQVLHVRMPAQRTGFGYKKEWTPFKIESHLNHSNFKLPADLWNPQALLDQRC